MSSMSYMEKLLDGVAVEWKALGDVAVIKRGTSITKKGVTHGEIPVIAGGRTPAYFHNVSNRTGQTIVIAGSGAYAGFVSWWEQPIFVSDAFTVKPSSILLPRYCYHFLLNMQQQLHDFKSGGGVPHVYPRNVAPIQIPIPCPGNPEKSLEIQAEIVRILDTFTELTAELTVELTARKNQYNYYRDQLLNFEEGEVEWKTLGEVTTLITKGTTPKSYELGGISFIKTEAFDGTQINRSKLSYVSETIHRTFLKRSILEEDDILFTIAGATIGKNAVVTSELLPANTNQALAIIRLLQTVNKKYILYILRSNHMKEYIDKCAKGSAQPNLNLQQINEFYIPLPSPEEQTRIVAILDKFDALTNSITEGLPREIALRQKQYEYYRDLLLSFPKSEEVAA